jgi:hypothetical protein
MTEKQDPNLSSPQEANTTKHINFAEAENEVNETRASDEKDDESPTKKKWEELREEQSK